MKKRIGWLTVAWAVCGCCASAEVVITSPTGLPDESDVVLESAVKAVKETPADVVEAVGGTVSYVGDELRNTAYGVKEAFKGETPRETVREELLKEVAGDWGAPDQIIFRSYTISPSVVSEMTSGSHAPGAVVDVSSFFTSMSSAKFPAGTSAYLWPDSQRLMVRNTPENLLEIETALSQYHHAEKEYKQVEIKAKFIEVSQNTLNQLGFTWHIKDNPNDGVGPGAWKINDNRDVFSTGLRTAAAAFGGTPNSGSMMLTKTGWLPLELTINALEQADDSDVLSAPSLTTLDGKEAEIWVGEDRKVPKGFSVNTSDMNVHIEHNDWDSQLMGVHFSVTPEIEQGNLIRLSLNPKIIDLIGYDNYKVSPDSYMIAIGGGEPLYQTVEGAYPLLSHIPGSSEVGDFWKAASATISGFYGAVTNLNHPDIRNVGPKKNTPNAQYGYIDESRRVDFKEHGFHLNAVYGRLPYFRVREIHTQAVVADGSTVGLGGLIYDRLETYKDKIPVLGSIPLIGRLFRSEGERSIKRNLMIFVSARQVASDGQSKSDVALNH